MIYETERIAAALAILFLMPLLMVIALVIAVLSRRGPLVCHTRVGWCGEPLAMLKFRTMWTAGVPSQERWGIEDVSGYVPPVKQSEDVRITSSFAAFCRRYSLDELPQLIHVVRGEMSLVGPRPITLAEIDQYYSDCAGEVLAMRPGLTGLWQISGRSQLTYAERKRLDLLLVRDASPRLYFSILIRSVPKILGGNGAC
jgi:exopolysaccharide production protein ExoY